MTNTDDTQQATAHTPEPWIFHKKGHNNRVNPSVEGADGTPVASCGGNLPGYGCYSPETYTRQEANARRIVAAVNACKGISTEALEQRVVAEMLEALVDLFNWLTPDWQQSSLGNKARAAIVAATGRPA